MSQVLRQEKKFLPIFKISEFRHELASAGALNFPSSLVHSIFQDIPSYLDELAGAGAVFMILAGRHMTREGGCAINHAQHGCETTHAA